jgi:hypothetical protein
MAAATSAGGSTTAVQGRRKSLLIRFLQPRTPLVEPRTPLIEPQNQEPIYVDNSNSPLLKLPGELRALIWEFAFTLSTEERLQVAQYFPKRRDAFGLILTCKQIRQEIGQLPYLSAVFVVWPGSQWPQGHQRGWVDLPAGYVLKWTNSLPLALRARPETVKCLAMGFSLFTRNDTIPLDSLIDSDILRDAGIKPKEFILKICICGSAKRLHIDPHRTMGFCIVLERLAMHFPTLERIVVYYCTKGAYASSEQTITLNHDFPNRVTGSHVVRSSSGAPWGIRTVKGSNGAKVEMRWEAAPHPGQALEAVPWTSRTVFIDYYDSAAVSGFACLRDRPKAESPKGEEFADAGTVTTPNEQ